MIPNSGSGRGTTCNYPASTSTCIYYGVDTSWYNSSICGSSFCRPKFNLDNPIWAQSTHQDANHKGFVTACSFDDSNANGIQVYQSGIIFDNWEFLGKCWTTLPTYGGDIEIKIMNGGTNIYNAIINSYFHGWTEVYNPQPNGQSPMDQAEMLGATSSTSSSHDVIAHDVFDGYDTSCGITNGSSCTGGPVAYGDAYEFYDNVVRWLAIGAIDYNTVLLHDNLFENMYESYDPASHSQVWEAPNPPNDCPASDISIYNNTVRNTNEGETWEISTCGGHTTYMFNNVFWNIKNPENCIIIDGTQSPAPQVFFTNNTIDGNGGLCEMRFLNGDFTGNVMLQNNQMIGAYTGPLVSKSNFFTGTTSGTISDGGGNIFQSESAANTQGYASGTNYVPTSGSGASIDAGVNLSSMCLTYSADSALCNSSTGGVTNAVGGGAIPTFLISNPVSRGSSWNAGAYQY